MASWRGVHALVGQCGIGKTQIALEHIYRHAKGYSLIWWVRAAKPATRQED